MSDWVLDLVATGFSKPQHLFGHTLRTHKDVEQLAVAFINSYDKVGLVAISFALNPQPCVTSHDSTSRMCGMSASVTGVALTYYVSCQMPCSLLRSHIGGWSPQVPYPCTCTLSLAHILKLSQRLLLPICFAEHVDSLLCLPDRPSRVEGSQQRCRKQRDIQSQCENFR